MTCLSPQGPQRTSYDYIILELLRQRLRRENLPDHSMLASSQTRLLHSYVLQI